MNHMLAHIIHDREGKIRAAVLQMDTSGELTINTGQPDDHVTIVDLREAPEIAPRQEDSSAPSRGYINLLSREICERHRLDIERKKLVPLS
jgi:hypothetical protein